MSLREKRSVNSTYKFQKIDQHASKFFSLQILESLLVQATVFLIAAQRK